MTIMQMFPNNSAVQAIREGGYGSADFDIADAPLAHILSGEQRRKAHQL